MNPYYFDHFLWYSGVFSFYMLNSVTGQKATIHQVTAMLTTSTNVLFPGQNHLLTTGAHDPSL